MDGYATGTTVMAISNRLQIQIIFLKTLYFCKKHRTKRNIGENVQLTGGRLFEKCKRNTTVSSIISCCCILFTLLRTNRHLSTILIIHWNEYSAWILIFLCHKAISFQVHKRLVMKFDMYCIKWR